MNDTPSTTPQKEKKMKKAPELRRLEWREKSDPQRVVVATLTWCPADGADFRGAQWED